jgi:hypothetical protein
VQFEKLSLEAGLRRLLKGHDVFFFVGDDDNPSGTLKGVWIYPKGQGRSLVPLLPATDSNAQDLMDADPDVRTRALEELAKRKGEQSLPAVLQALRDPEESVRCQALYIALNSTVLLPTGVLEDLIRNDSSSVVRGLAMEEIINLSSQQPGVGRAIAEFAMSDSDPEVREQAQLILDMESQAHKIEQTQGGKVQLEKKERQKEQEATQKKHDGTE